MAQKLKETVRKAILDSAADCFLEKGFQQTNLLDIAHNAGIAAGNLYRYYKNKEEIFYAALPPENIENLMEILKSKFNASRGLQAGEIFAAGGILQDELIELLTANRKYWIIVFLKSGGTKYSDIKEELTGFLADLYGIYMQSLDGKCEKKAGAGEYFLILQVYRALIDSICAVMKDYEDAAAIKSLCRRLFTYHFAGLEALFPVGNI